MKKPINKKMQQVKTWCVFISIKILYSLNFDQLSYWNQLSKFFQDITSISGKIAPSLPKPQKITMIQAELKKIVIPPGMYLPTNPNFRIKLIKVDFHQRTNF